MSILEIIEKMYPQNYIGMKEKYKTDIYQTFSSFFDQHIGTHFRLIRHNDPSLKPNLLIRLIHVYPQHIVVDVLSTNQERLFSTSIAYASLLDCDNSQEIPFYEIHFLSTPQTKPKPSSPFTFEKIIKD